MLIFKLAVKNLMRRMRRTALIGVLISTGMAVLFVANAIFETTDSGLKTSFVGSLTGDLSIRQATIEPFSLFGNEIPIVSEYSVIPSIDNYREMLSVVSSVKGIAATAPVVSGAASMKVGDISRLVPVFGVDPQAYFNVCKDVKLVRGKFFLPGSSGIMLNEVKANELEAALKRPLVENEPILLSMYRNGSFQLRKTFFTGVFRYKAPSDTLNRIVLADPAIVRALMGYTLGSSVTPDAKEASVNDSTGSIDDLFSDPEDITAPQNNTITLEGLKDDLADTAARDELLTSDATAWNFLLIGLERPETVAETQFSIDAALRKDFSVVVMDWRATAGSSAQVLYVVRMVFLVGMIFLFIGAVVVVMNSLVISVLERSGEIGTMRAVGAGKLFIMRLFVTETMILTMFSALLGIGVGVVVTYFISSHGISLSNPMLISLFGGPKIVPVVSAFSIFEHLIIAAGIGMVAWIYPVLVAIRISPVGAMTVV